MAEEAIARARRGEGPTLIEAETYRFRGHSLADPDELRKKEEKQHYQVGSRLLDEALHKGTLHLDKRDGAAQLHWHCS